MNKPLRNYKQVKLTVGVLLVFLFLSTIPGAIQNFSHYKEIKNQLMQFIEMSEKICDSGCTDYPRDWVIKGLELQAQNHCLQQCMDRENLRSKIIETVLPLQYESQYNYWVMQLYCVTGLFCPPAEIMEMKKG